VWKYAPVLRLADASYVLMMWDYTETDPVDATREYVRNHFNVLRIENGTEKEHWDEGQIKPPAKGK